MNICIFGANGGIGFAYLSYYLNNADVNFCYAVVRNRIDLEERLSRINFDNNKLRVIELIELTDESLASFNHDCRQNKVEFSYVINTIGQLHNEEFMPEKMLSKVSVEHLHWSVNQNVVPCMLITKHCSRLMDKTALSAIIHVTAKVGSITDNRLGGWYSYRMSKAMMHMFIKTASIELKRLNKNLVIAAIHPGTTDSKLSKPFQKHVPTEKLFSPDKSVGLMIENQLSKLTEEKSGTLLNWDGSILPW